MRIDIYIYLIILQNTYPDAISRMFHTHIQTTHTILEGFVGPMEVETYGEDERERERDGEDYNTY